jgi:uncharacterized protein (TIGR02284 family)
MNTQKSIDVLNTLIEINNDRIEGYESASKETEEEDLKALFAQFTKTSEKCKKELVTEVRALGGTPPDETTLMGKFFRVWMDVKAAFTSNDRKTILSSCEYGEDVAVEAYNKALKYNQEDTTTSQRAMLTEQHAMLKADYDTIKNLGDKA